MLFGSDHSMLGLRGNIIFGCRAQLSSLLDMLTNMGLPTVAEMCATLNDDLHPTAGFVAPDLEVSAVHVSELADPTSYLSGGELLLTTGLSLPDSAMGCERYVSRLKAAGVSALGLGLGPFLAHIPDPLTESCRKYGLCLLVIPPATAFLTVTKAYWTARSRSTQQELSDAITAHRSLVNSMVSSDPVGETLKTLSASIGVWVAKLDAAGTVEQVFPSGRIHDAVAAADQIKNLRVAGIHSAVTFPSGDEVVVVFPLPLEERVVGYIAIGSTTRLSPTDRRLVLTATALLSLDSVQRQRVDAAKQAQMQAAGSLLDMGFIDAARRMSSRLGLPTLGVAGRVLVVRSIKTPDIVEIVHRWTAGAVPGPREGDRLWFVIPEIHPATGHLAQLLHDIDPQASAMLSDVVAMGAVHEVRVGLFELVSSMPAGVVSAPRTAELRTEGLEDGLHKVLTHSRSDLVSSLVAYLRRRGQWDLAARDLDVHRNTLRYRIAKCRELIGLDLDDADVASELWLYLRKNGLA